MDINKINELLGNENIDEHFRFHLTAIWDNNGDMTAAYDSIKGKTPYRSLYLFNKSMTSRIEKALNGHLPKPVIIKEKVKKDKQQETIEEIVQEPGNNKSIRDLMHINREDKKLVDTLAALNDAGYETIDDIAKMTKKRILDIKGIGPKKLEVLEDYMRKNGINLQ